MVRHLGGHSLEDSPQAVMLRELEKVTAPYLYVTVNSSEYDPVFDEEGVIVEVECYDVQSAHTARATQFDLRVAAELEVVCVCASQNRKQKWVNQRVWDLETSRSPLLKQRIVVSGSGGCVNVCVVTMWSDDCAACGDATLAANFELPAGARQLYLEDEGAVVLSSSGLFEMASVWLIEGVLEMQRVVLPSRELFEMTSVWRMDEIENRSGDDSVDVQETYDVQSAHTEGATQQLIEVQLFGIDEVEGNALGFVQMLDVVPTKESRDNRQSRPGLRRGHEQHGDGAQGQVCVRERHADGGHSALCQGPQL